MGIRREKLDHVPRLLDATPTSIISQVCPPIARRPLPKIGGHRSPIVAFVRMPWAVLEEACLSIRCQFFRPLAEAIPSWFPETGFGGSSFPSRIPKPPKLWTTSSARRSHEDVLFRRSQSASPGTHSALCRSGFGLSSINASGLE